MEEELSWSHSEQPTELVAIGELIFCCATSYLPKQGTFQALTVCLKRRSSWQKLEGNLLPNWTAEYIYGMIKCMVEDLAHYQAMFVTAWAVSMFYISNMNGEAWQSSV